MFNKTSFMGLVMFFVWISTASALTIDYRTTTNVSLFSGEYMFTVTDPKNDKPGDMALIVGAAEAWFKAKDIDLASDFAFDFFDKVDEPKTEGKIGMTVTYFDDYHGEWTTTLPVEFYTVKSANEFALYWLEGGASSGLWSTQHLLNSGGNIPEISHLSTWNPMVPNPVPEPGTLLLLGSGIAGLVAAKRRKKV